MEVNRECPYRFCDHCTRKFEEVPYYGVGEPTTIKLLEFAKSGTIEDRLYNFCSKKCCEQWEKEHSYST